MPTTVTLKPRAVTTIASYPFPGPGVSDWNFPTSVENEDATSPGDILCALNDLAVSTGSYALVCTDFGFDAHINAGDLINGIQISLKRGCGDTGYPLEVSTQFVTPWVDGASVGHNPAFGVGANWTTALVWEYWGDSSDLWSWADANGVNIRKSTFGCIIAIGNGTSHPTTAGIDVVELAVTFTPRALNSNPPILTGGQLGRFGIRTGGRLYRHASHQFPAQMPGLEFPRERIRQSWPTPASRASTSARRETSSSSGRA